ncbi:MAG: hypothetical protein ABFQ62_03325 [Patescibacteria group bacterium]
MIEDLKQNDSFSSLEFDWLIMHYLEFLWHVMPQMSEAYGAYVDSVLLQASVSEFYKCLPSREELDQDDQLEAFANSVQEAINQTSVSKEDKSNKSVFEFITWLISKTKSMDLLIFFDQMLSQ